MDCAVRKLNPHKRTINEKLIKKKQKKTELMCGLGYFFLWIFLNWDNFILLRIAGGHVRFFVLCQSIN